MQQLMLRNSLTQSQKEPFVPHNHHDITLYCCGPTVYDVPHLGHARTYIFLDLLTRILRHHYGYGVRSVMNITDLDDKILAKGSDAREYERLFFQTMTRLNVQRPDFTPRVTQHLDVIRRKTVQCQQKGFAYSGPETGSTYFETEKYLKRYGRVFPHSEKRDLHSMTPAAPHPDKKDPRDFALWKKKTDGTEMPGWHAECAALCAHHFGASVDLHLGGIDLQFPHHENELSLGRVLYDTPQWIRYVLHAGPLLIEGRKMSKSLKNFITVEEVVAQGVSPLALRYYFLKHPYDQPMHFTKSELEKAQLAYERFSRHLQKVARHWQTLQRKEAEGHVEDVVIQSHRIRSHELNQLKETLETHLSDNLNVPAALCALERFVRQLSASIDRGGESAAWLGYVWRYVRHVVDVYLGLMEEEVVEDKTKTVQCLELLDIVETFRSNMRALALKGDSGKESVLDACDKVRAVLKAKGYVIEDSVPSSGRTQHSKTKERMENDEFNGRSGGGAECTAGDGN